MSYMLSLFELAIGILGSLILLRAYLWTLAISPRDPLVRFVWKFTDWIVNPIGYVVRPRGNWDWTSLTTALLLALVDVLMLRELTGFPVTAAAFALAPFALVLRWVIDLMTWGLIIYCVMSFTSNPMSPYWALINTLVDPFVRPIRRFIPTIGRFDLSPIVLFLILSFAERFVALASRGGLFL